MRRWLAVTLTLLLVATGCLGLLDDAGSEERSAASLKNASLAVDRPETYRFRAETTMQLEERSRPDGALQRSATVGLLGAGAVARSDDVVRSDWRISLLQSEGERVSGGGTREIRTVIGPDWIQTRSGRPTAAWSSRPTPATGAQIDKLAAVRRLLANASVRSAGTRTVNGTETRALRLRLDGWGRRQAFAIASIDAALAGAIDEGEVIADTLAGTPSANATVMIAPRTGRILRSEVDVTGRIADPYAASRREIAVEATTTFHGHGSAVDASMPAAAPPKAPRDRAGAPSTILGITISDADNAVAVSYHEHESSAFAAFGVDRPPEYVEVTLSGWGDRAVVRLDRPGDDLLLDARGIDLEGNATLLREPGSWPTDGDRISVVAREVDGARSTVVRSENGTL